MDGLNRQTAVITGSAGGLGAGIAEAFLRRGFNVVLSDNNRELLEQKRVELALIYADKVTATVCDVTDPQDLKNLWQVAIGKYDHIDYWLNNAGIGGTQKHIIDSDLKQLNTIINVNIIGVVNGTHVALNGMAKQESGGHIFNTAGFGEDGYTRATMVAYGMSKRAVGYFSNGVAKELKGSQITIGWHNPGVVITPMIINYAKQVGEQAWRKQGRIIFRLFAKTADEVGEILVTKMLASKRNGRFIKLLPHWKIVLGFFVNWFRKDKLKDFGI